MNRRTIPEKAQQEIIIIMETIPKCAETIERGRLNAKVRELLSSASNDAVAFLALHNDHQLSLRELFRRLREGEFKDLSELFRLLELIAHYPACRSSRKLLDLGIPLALKAADSSSPLEIAECLRDYRPDLSMVCGDLYIHESICKRRPDTEEIVSLLRSFGIKVEHVFGNLTK